MEKGYGGTTMDDIAARAGIAKRTLYNNYADKAALFGEIVSGVLTFADVFVRGLNDEFASVVKPGDLPPLLHQVAQRMALGIIRPEVIALRRLLIGEARIFPEFAKEYFDRAPGQVINALDSIFAQLVNRRMLKSTDTRRAAEQFAYLVVGAPLDRALLVGSTPPKHELMECAREGVETFLARYSAH
jgi:TetR/AcrR family transcriptional repressor of mexJK operon